LDYHRWAIIVPLDGTVNVSRRALAPLTPSWESRNTSLLYITPRIYTIRYIKIGIVEVFVKQATATRAPVVWIIHPFHALNVIFTCSCRNSSSVNLWLRLQPFFHLLLDVGDFDTEFFQVQNLRFAMRSTITSVAIAVWLVAACRCAFMAPTVAVAAYRIT